MLSLPDAPLFDILSSSDNPGAWPRVSRDMRRIASMNMKALMLARRDGSHPLALAAAARGHDQSPGLMGPVFESLLGDMSRDAVSRAEEMAYGKLAVCAMLRDGGSSSVAGLDRMIAAFAHVTKADLLHSINDLLFSAVADCRRPDVDSIRWLAGDDDDDDDGNTLELASRVARRGRRLRRRMGGLRRARQRRPRSARARAPGVARPPRLPLGQIHGATM